MDVWAQKQNGAVENILTETMTIRPRQQEKEDTFPF